MEMKKALHDSIIMPALTYVSESWTGNVGQRSRIQADEMSYLRGACGLNRVDGENSESVCGKFGMSVKCEGMDCGVGEVVKRSNLRWFSYFRE